MAQNCLRLSRSLLDPATARGVAIAVIGGIFLNLCYQPKQTFVVCDKLAVSQFPEPVARFTKGAPRNY